MDSEFIISGTSGIGFLDFDNESSELIGSIIGVEDFREMEFIDIFEHKDGLRVGKTRRFEVSQSHSPIYR